MDRAARPPKHLPQKRDPRPVVYVATADGGLEAQLLRAVIAPGHDTGTFADATALLAGITPERPGCALIDADLPGGSDGVELVAELRRCAPELVVVVVAAPGDVPSAVRALRAGAFDLFERPLSEAVVRRRVLEAVDALRSVPVAPDQKGVKAGDPKRSMA